VGVDKVDDVRADGGLEDGGELDGGLQLGTVGRVDTDNRASASLRTDRSSLNGMDG